MSFIVSFNINDVSIFDEKLKKWPSLVRYRHVGRCDDLIILPIKIRVSIEFYIFAEQPAYVSKQFVGVITLVVLFGVKSVAQVGDVCGDPYIPWFKLR